MGRNRRNKNKKESKKGGESPQQPYVPPQRHPNDAESDNKEESKKRQESPPELYVPPQRLETDEEPAPEDESIAEETLTLLEGEYVLMELSEQHDFNVEPYKDRHDTTSFILNWMRFLLGLIVLLIGAVVLGIVERHETLWKSLFLLCLTFFLVTGSFCLALWADFSVFLCFVFKWMSFVNFFVIVSFTGVVFSRSYLHNASFDEMFWTLVPWLCVVWLSAVQSIGIAWFSIRDRRRLQINLPDFLLFFTQYGVAFFLLLAIPSLDILYGSNILAIHLDDTLWTFMAWIASFFVFATLSFFMALFLNSWQCRRYSFGRITGSMFLHMISEARFRTD